MPPARNARKPRKSPTDKPPRPPNAWILYRTDRLKRLREDNDGPPRKQADISKLLGVLWAQEPDEVKRQYEKAAEIAKAKHAEKYPGYKYQPTSKEEKLKLQEEAKAAKKAAAEQAKAAKAAARKASGGRRSTTSSGPRTPVSLPDPSTVKTQDFVPIDRGCGPSPPLDSDDESSVFSSAPSFQSESASSQPPSFSEAVLAAQTLLPAPLPSYPIGFHSNVDDASHLPSDVPQPGPVLSSAAATPSDSPPSYAAAGQWPIGSDTLAFLPSLWQGADFPGLTDASRALLEAQTTREINSVVTDIQSRLLHYIPYVPHSPPGEVDLSNMPSPPALPTPEQEQPVHDEDVLAPAIAMAEFHEAVEDATFAQPDRAAVPMPMLNADIPFSFEELEGFELLHTEVAHTVMNANEFYRDLGAETAWSYPNLVLQHQEAPFSIDPVDEPVVFDCAMAQQQQQQQQQERRISPEEQDFFLQQALAGTTFTDDAAFATEVDMHPQLQFDSGFMQEQLQMAMPTGQANFSLESLDAFLAAAPPPTPDVSSTASTPAPALGPAPAPVELANAQSAQAPQTQRYVPPGGAGLAPRRRVGARYTYPPTQELTGSQPNSGFA